MSILTATLIVLIQVATGSLLILLLPSSRIRSKFEIIGLGLALGTFISMLSSVLLVHTALNPVAWVLPTVVIMGAALFRFNFVRSRMRQMTLPRNESIAVAIGLLIGFALLVINWIRIPISSIRAGRSVDMYFFEALAKGVSEFGASESILMSRGSLRYHWFSYGWAGEVGQLADTDSFVALTRILPVVALIGVVLLAAAWTGSIRIGKSKPPRWVPTLAVILIVFSGYTGALYGIVLNIDSPSQAFTTIWLLALVMLFLRGLRSSTRTEFFSYLALIVLMAGATTGGKASHIAVAIGGFALVSVFAIIRRPCWWRRALVLFASTIVSAVLVYVWVLAGVGLEANLGDSIAVRASTWQGLDPVVGKWGPLLGTIALLLAVLPRVIGVSWLASNESGRTSPEFYFALGSLGVGAVALFVLRGGINELWFLLAASAPMAVISSFGIGQAQSWLHPRIRPALIYTVVIAALASLLSLVLSMNWKFDRKPNEFFLWPGIFYWLSVTAVWVLIVTGSLLAVRHFMLKTASGKRPDFFTAFFALSISALALTSVFTRPAVLWTESRTLSTDIGVVNPTPELGVISPTTNAGESPLTDLISAAEWVSANTERSDQIATNSPVSAFIPALTGNQMYLAGARYQAGLGAASQLSEVDRREKISASIPGVIKKDLSYETVLQELCEAGVVYVWIEETITTDEHPTVYSNESVSVYSLNKQCGEMANN